MWLTVLFSTVVLARGAESALQQRPHVLPLLASTTAARACSPSLSSRVRAARSAFKTMVTWSRCVLDCAQVLCGPRGNRSDAHGASNRGAQWNGPHGDEKKRTNTHMGIGRRTWRTRRTQMGTRIAQSARLCLPLRDASHDAGTAGVAVVVSTGASVARCGFVFATRVT